MIARVTFVETGAVDETGTAFYEIRRDGDVVLGRLLAPPFVAVALESALSLAVTLHDVLHQEASA